MMMVDGSEVVEGEVMGDEADVTEDDEEDAKQEIVQQQLAELGEEDDEGEEEEMDEDDETYSPVVDEELIDDPRPKRKLRSTGKKIEDEDESFVCDLCDRSFKTTTVC